MSTQAPCQTGSLTIPPAEHTRLRLALRKIIRHQGGESSSSCNQVAHEVRSLRLNGVAGLCGPDVAGNAVVHGPPFVFEERQAAAHSRPARDFLFADRRPFRRRHDFCAIRFLTLDAAVSQRSMVPGRGAEPEAGCDSVLHGHLILSEKRAPFTRSPWSSQRPLTSAAVFLPGIRLSNRSGEAILIGCPRHITSRC